MVTHRARNFEDAERWDLEFWQNQTPEMRLSALVAIRRDILNVRRNYFEKTPETVRLLSRVGGIIMDTVRDFEDILALLEKHKVKYLIIGGLAFIYHAKPRYTKDMDLLIEPSADNVARVNSALAEFGSPLLLNAGNAEEILQIGLPPDRIDIMLKIPGVRFETAWRKRIRGRYGNVKVNWIDLDSLIRAKRHVEGPRHREDVRVLLEVKKMRAPPKRAHLGKATKSRLL